MSELITDSVIIGAGVIGLAIARQLAAHPTINEQLILEQEEHFGSGISSLNSEVIHAGLYYPEQSLKAQLCCRGKALLYDFCAARQISHHRCGKLIVATSSAELNTLEHIHQQATRNGVNDLEDWQPSTIARHEPQVRGCAALFSPSTGIVDSHQLMLSLLAEAESQGSQLICRTRLERITPTTDGFYLQGDSAGETFKIKTRRLINAAGLGAQAVAAQIEDFPSTHIPPSLFCKGNYFALQGAAPFSHLIYPVPEASGAGLGIHATLDLQGQVRFGPDTEAIIDTAHSELDYSVSQQRLSHYYEAIRRYYPGLKDDKLTPAYVGYRPKTQRAGEPPQDFIIQGPREHHYQGLVQLFGIESPGLTASLAIAEHVEQLLETNQ